MNFPFRAAGKRAQGFALATTLCLMAVCLIVFGSIYYWAYSNTVLTQRNNQYNMSENAAEAAVERVIGQMDRDFVSASVSTNGSSYASLVTSINQTNWPVQYVFADTNGISNQISVVIGPQASYTIVNSQYSNLLAYARSVDVYATATPVGQMYDVPATVHESLQLANLPLYQFAIFYNVNLEVMSAAGLDIYGPVFCNQNIWEGSTKANFYSTVTAVGTNAPQVQDPFCDYTGSGASVFHLTGQPLSKANSLVVPIGTNNDPASVMAMLQLPPTNYLMNTPNAYSSNGIAYPANACDLFITNFVCGTNDGTVPPYGTNMYVYFQDQSLTPPASLKLEPFDFYIMTNRTSQSLVATPSNYVAPAFYSNIWFATYTFVTNSRFYDWREGYNGGSGPAKRVEAVDIDINLLNKWMTNQSVVNSGYTDDQNKSLHSNHHIGGIYVYTSVQPTATMIPAVRVHNGAALPEPALSAGQNRYGVTVATQVPIYVLGNYNCQDKTGSSLSQNGTSTPLTHILPASLMGDAITILSPSWNDGNSANNNASSGGPGASSSTVNAAMLCGIVQSNPAKTGNRGYNGDYSGGVENFLRLLENWGSSTLTYNGSIVVLFYSGYATNVWVQTGKYYGAPTRNWAFDLNYNNVNKLPPMTPQLKTMVRGNWYAHQ